MMIKIKGHDDNQLWDHNICSHFNKEITLLHNDKICKSDGAICIAYNSMKQLRTEHMVCRMFKVKS